MLQAQAQPLTFVPVNVVSVRTAGLSGLGNASTKGMTRDSRSGCLNIQGHPGKTRVRLHSISPGRKCIGRTDPTWLSDLMGKGHAAEGLWEGAFLLAGEAEPTPRGQGHK